MTHYREQPFEISRTDEDSWVVDFGGTPISVDSHAAAVLLADLPVQLCKAVSTNREPDMEKTGQILALCDEYHLGNVFAVRQLKSCLKRNRR